MGIPKQSTRTTFTSTPAAWKKIFSSPTPDRTGVALFVDPASALDALVRILPLGTAAPSTFLASDGDEIVYKGSTRLWNQDARDNVDIYACGFDGSGGAFTGTAWEVMG